MVTGQGHGLGIGGCKRLCPMDNRAPFGYTFSLSVSVKVRSLHWVLGKSQIYYPEHILGYGHREGLLLSCRGFWLFLDRTDSRRGWWRSKQGLKSGGLESKFRQRPRPCDRRVMGWSCLCLGYKWGVCFGVSSWAH